jgi:hypothetical protein
MRDLHSNEHASIQATNLKTSESSVRVFGKQAEFGARQEKYCRGLREALEKEDREQKVVRGVNGSPYGNPAFHAR